ncbi:MAG TPA: FAD-dependent oxidoreductase [Anaerolineae bacterium]
MDDRAPDKDILVIGAGLVGAMIAYQLANGGRHVAVVDAMKAGQSATRRAIGLATPLLSREHIADTTRGVDILTNLAVHLAVSPRACRVMHLASKPADTEALHAMCDALPDNHRALAWIEGPGSLVPAGYTGGLVAQNSVQIDLDVLTLHLLQHPNITLYEDIEILALNANPGHLTAIAAGYSVRANAIVLATNAYAGLLSPYLGDALHLVRSVTWTSKPLDSNQRLLELMLQAVPMPLVIDHGRLVLSQTRDWRLRIYARKSTVRSDPAAAITDYLHEHLPELMAHSEDWCSGVTSTTPDSAPLVGRLANDTLVLYALGAGMNGPAWAPIMAERIQQLVEG